MSETRDFQLAVTGLEVALGHDGFLRGHPEPVLVVAVYARTARGVQLLGRSLHRFQARGQLPCAVSPDVTSALNVRLRSRAVRDFVVLVMAMEEDGRVDIQRMYGAVEDHRTFSVWSGSKGDVQPLQVAELPQGRSDWNYPVPIEVQVDGQDASLLCTTDKWIGAVAWVLSIESWAAGGVFRARFLSPDRRNDWTALLSTWSSASAAAR